MTDLIVFQPYAGALTQSGSVDGCLLRLNALASIASLASHHGIVSGNLSPLDAGKKPPDNVGTVSGTFPAWDALATISSSVVAALLPRPAAAASSLFFYIPDITVSYGELPLFTGKAVGVYHRIGTVDGALRRFDGFATVRSKPVMRAFMRVPDASAIAAIPYVGGFYLGRSPGVTWMIDSDPSREVVLERFGLHAATKGQPIFTIMEHLKLVDQPHTTAAIKNTIVDDLQMGDTLAVIWKLLVQEHLQFHPSVNPATIHAAKIVEILTLIAGPKSSLAARNAVAAALALIDHAGVVFKFTVSEHLGLHETVKASLAAYANILDTIILRDNPKQGVVFSAIVKEGLNLHDSSVTKMTMRNLIAEGLYLGAQIRLGDDVYTAWVVNTSNRAATEYDNFPFNSFFEIGGRYFGVSDTGVNELTGTDDNAVNIESYMRTGLTDFGTGKMKRVPSVYWGYTSDGTMVLKAITTSPEGEKIENWYKMTQRTADVTREARISLGRGMESVYWQFELHNVDGSTFDINTMELLPVILDRRIRSN
jgi:hypothetical protein